MLFVMITLATGCGGVSNEAEANVLSIREARLVLRETPFQFRFRNVNLPEGATGALAGRIIGPHHTVVAFGLALGRQTAAVPVPESGIENAVSVPPAGFVFNINTLVKHRGSYRRSRELKGEAQLNEAGEMQFEIEERLCRAATGKPCPV